MQNFLLICYTEWEKTNHLKVVAKQAFPSSSLTSDAKDKKHFQRENAFVVKAEILEEMRDRSLLTVCSLY